MNCTAWLKHIFAKAFVTVLKEELRLLASLILIVRERDSSESIDMQTR